jgi:large subunit ribosomal protein L4
MNKKAHKAAMRSALTSLCKDSKLTVLNNLDLESISTKTFYSLLNRFGFTKTLVVIDDQNQNLQLSARNVKNVKVLSADALNVYDMMNFKNVVFTESSVRKVEGALQI